jgi:hypothetical protein
MQDAARNPAMLRNPAFCLFPKSLMTRIGFDMDGPAAANPSLFERLASLAGWR